jgi:tetratricopeptide (TPR) repeat protein
VSQDVEHDWLDRGILLTELGRPGDAEHAFREALRQDPDDALTHALLALVLNELDRPGEAVESAESAIALAPDFAIAHAARAQALLALEQYAPAEQSAREALRIDPEDAQGHVLLAAILASRGRWQEAAAETERALRLDPESPNARGLHAYAAARAGGTPGSKSDAWEDDAAKALAAAPDSAVAHMLAGHAYLVRGHEEEALERFREALRLDPESEGAQAGLAATMKAAHPLFRPFYRFFIWQQQLSRGWKIGLTVGPIIVLRALRPAADNPFVLALVVAWILFVALTWASVPLANLGLRLSRVGRNVLPAEEKRSSSMFLALVATCLVAVVLGLAVNGSFVGAAIALGLLAFPLGSSHGLSRRVRRTVEAVGGVAAVGAVAGAILVTAGLEGPGAILLLAGFGAGIVLLWVVRLS